MIDIFLDDLPLTFSSIKEYKDKLALFINEEEQCSISQKSQIRSDDIKGKWKSKSIFKFHSSISTARSLLPGTVLKVSLLNQEDISLRNINDDTSYVEYAYVIKKTHNDVIKIEFGEDSKFYNQSSLRFRIAVSNIPFKRQRTALKEFTKEFFLKIFIGDLSNINKKTKNPVDFDSLDDWLPFEAKSLKINQSQSDAIKHALTHRFSIIQGPPGPGKSTCIALQAYLYSKNGEKVLVVTHSNAAANHITEIMLSMGIEPIRVVGSTYEPVAQGIKGIIPALSFLKTGATGWGKRLKESGIISKANIVIATTVTSGGARFNQCDFTKVIVDEANQLIDVELMIPLCNKCKQLTLYGDHLQIGPFVASKKSKKYHLGRSLVERLPELRFTPQMLMYQYRMNPYLSAFPSQQFYSSMLRDGITKRDREIKTDKIIFPNKDAPIVFYDTKSPEASTGDGFSFLNYGEAAWIGEVIRQLHLGNIQPNQIAVITFYNGLIELLKKSLSEVSNVDEKYCKEIRIDTVDAFEGSDIDFVILVTVRSNPRKSVGFLSDKGRMNVALTRAKYAMFILGNAANLISDPIWKAYIDYCQSNNVVVQLH